MALRCMSHTCLSGLLLRRRDEPANVKSTTPLQCAVRPVMFLLAYMQDGILVLRATTREPCISGLSAGKLSPKAFV